MIRAGRRGQVAGHGQATYGGDEPLGHGLGERGGEGDREAPPNRVRSLLQANRGLGVLAGAARRLTAIPGVPAVMAAVAATAASAEDFVAVQSLIAAVP